MKKRLVTLLMAITVAFGSLAPDATVYAQEELPVLEEAKDLVGCAEDECTEDASVEASSEEEPKEASDEEKDIEENGSEDGKKNAEAGKESGAQETPVSTGETSGEAASEGNTNAADEAATEGSKETPEEQQEQEDAADEATAEASAEEDAASEASSEEDLEEAAIEDEEDKDLLEAKTKFVDGYDTKTRIAAVGGKLITGWINAKPDSDGVYEITATGSKALSAKDGNVYYIDPATKMAVGGVNTIGGKRYLFLETDSASAWGMLARGEGKARTIESGVGTGKNTYLVKASGEITTGWYNPKTGKEAVISDDQYYDPTTGALAKDAWVPRGKGLTYVDAHGKLADSVGLMIDNGLFYINGDYYCFKNSVRISGLVFFDDKNEIVSQAKASYARFFDPDSGKMRTAYFASGGKFYHAGYNSYWTWTENDIDKGMEYGKILLDGTLRLIAGSSRCYTEKNGTLAVNKLITLNGKKYYAKADGSLCMKEYMLINGRYCYFGSDCSMLEGTEKGTGVETNYYSYEDGSDRIPLEHVYVRNKSNKATDGIFFYADKECTKKLTNCWLITIVTLTPSKQNREIYLDKNGNPVKGIVKIGDTKYMFDQKTGKVMRWTYKDADGAYAPHIVKVGGKNYLLGSDGIIADKEGFHNIGGIHYFIKKNGTIATGMTTINGRKYYFYPDGALHTDELLILNGKAYAVNQGHYREPLDYFVLEKKDYPSDIFMMVNSDGSLFSGWKTIKGKKYFYEFGVLAAEGLGSGSDDTVEFNTVNGKRYYFSPEGYANTGWVTIEKGMKYDFDPLESTFIHASVPVTAERTMKFYFDPKTCAAVVGLKTIGKNTYYFRTKDSDDGTFGGMMVTGETLNINGKFCTFDDNGVLQKTVTGGKKQVTENGSKVNYYLSPRTGKNETGVVRKTGSKWFYYGKDGKQSTGLTTVNMDGKTIEAVFNKDGSIKAFYAGDVKQTDIMIGGSGNLSGYYFLGSNGLPATGLYALPSDVSMDLTKTTNAKVYIHSDGYCVYKGKGTAGADYSLVRSGKKTYVINSLGFTVADTKTLYRISDYSGLSEAEQKAFARYVDEHREFAGNFSEVCTFASKENVSVCVNADGSLATSKSVVLSDGRTVHLNKLGIPNEELGLIIKVGSSWYLNSNVKCGGERIKSINCKIMDNTSFREGKAEITFDANGKMDAATNKLTSKALNGLYSIFDLAAVNYDNREYKNIDGSQSTFIYFKNGYPQAGKRTVRAGGEKVTYEIDPETGWCNVIPDPVFG